MFACIFVPNFPADPLYPSNRQALLDCAYAFSPRVEDTAPGTVVFDIEGLERLFGSYEEIRRRVCEHVRKFGWTASVEVAANPDLAIALARGGGRRIEDLPLGIISPPEEMLETLDRWGIRTLGAFARLPAVEVSERLGQEGVRLHKLAKGTASRPLVPHRDSLQFVESMELDYAIEAIEPLTFILSRLLEQLCRRLSARNLATHEVRLTLSAACERILRLPLPVRNPKLLAKLLILDLEAHPPGFAVASLKIEAIPAKPRVVQNGLFVPLSPEPEKLELTLARISALVGEGNIGAPEILDTHRPDAFRINSFSRGLRELRGWAPGHSDNSQALALRLYRPPLEATVRSKNSLPVGIAFHNVHGPVAAASGPWHTSGDWWNGNKWDREEWDIELLDSLYRIYRDVPSGRWFVEGVYD